MSDVYDIKILVQSQLEELQKTNDAVSKMADTMNSEASGVGKVWSGVLLDVGAKINNLATKLPSALAQTIRAFGEQEAAVQRLSTAIRANGGSVAEVLPIMQNLASEIQRITTIGDEQVLAMQAMASAMGVNAEQMQKCIEGAIGLSNVYGLGLNEAVKASASVIQGKSEKLNELIPTLSQCKTESERLTLAQKAMRDGFAIAKSESETLNGKLQQAANAWGDLQEVIGGTFAPTVKSVAGLLQGLCEFFSENDTLTKTLTASLSSLAVGFAFTKVGGLPIVAGLFKRLATAIGGAKFASDALNTSLRANPVGLALSAITALTLAVSHLRAKEKERYDENIKQSQEYRASLQAEIDTLNQWGIFANDNKKRTAEITAELEKLRSKRDSLSWEKSSVMQVRARGVSSVDFSEEKQKELDNTIAKIEELEKLLKKLANVKELDAQASKAQTNADAKSAEILKKSTAEIRALTSATEALKQTRDKYANLEKEIASLEKGFAGETIKYTEREAKARRLAQARLETTKFVVDFQKLSSTGLLNLWQ